MHTGALTLLAEGPCIHTSALTLLRTAMTCSVGRVCQAAATHQALHTQGQILYSLHLDSLGAGRAPGAARAPAPGPGRQQRPAALAHGRRAVERQAQPHARRAAQAARAPRLVRRCARKERFSARSMNAASICQDMWLLAQTQRARALHMSCKLLFLQAYRR